MSKEKKKDDNRKNGKASGRRFGKKRENYVDSFRWGFVEGEPNEDVGPDDELYFGEPEEDEKPAPAREKKNRPPRKSGKGNENAAKAGAPEKAPKPAADRNRKKQAKKTVPAYPLFDDDDDDDLNLPSYGRTPIPTDDELPEPVTKSIPKKGPERKERNRDNRDRRDKPEKTTEKREPAAEKKRPETPVSQTAPSASKRPAERERPTEDRPRRQQMVWDPDKREYVPLVVPEPAPRKKSSRSRATQDRTAQEIPKAAKPAVEEPTEEERQSEPRSSKRSRPRKKGSKATAPAQAAEPETPLVETVPQKPRQENTRKQETIPAPPTETAEEKPSSRRNRKKSREKRPETIYPAAQQRGDVPPLVESNVPDPSDAEADVRGFAELGVSETMLEALKVVRYLEPTPIQAGVFKQVQAGTDVMGQAQTGTGKTAAFSIPIIEGVEECPPGNDPVALILVPTRELAVQVRDEASRLCYGRDVRIAACYGGKPIAKQISKLRDGIDIVVGTPGRILDLMNRRALSLDTLRWVVLDEADRMLDIGFRPDIEKILKRTPKDRQTLLFSATLPPPVVRLAERYMNSPEVLDFSNKGVAVDTIEQYYVTVDPERKFDALLFLLEEQQPNQAIIFTRTKRGADRLARLLSKRLDSIAAIHGDLSQGERDRVMGQFRTGKLRYLVATDVVGRGIDVSGISHIINYDVPAFCDDYVHRVGRTGRMGREGVAYTFVTVQEGSELTRIEMRIDKLLKRADLKGFESYTKPTDPNANIDDLMSETPAETKPVYGKPTRKIRRAL